MHLILEEIELKDNKVNDNTFDIFYDVNTKLIHAVENGVVNPREFVYRLVDTEENIAKNHRQEILEYCLATILPSDTVGLGDIFLHRKYVERLSVNNLVD